MRPPVVAFALLTACASSTPSPDRGPHEPGPDPRPAAPTPNGAPQLELRSLTIEEDTTGVGSLVAADPDGDPVAWTMTSAPLHGVVDLDPAARTFRYAPHADFVGDDGFVLEASDPRGATASQTVEVTVLPVNDPPRAIPIGGLEVRRGGALEELLRGVDVEGDALTWSLETPPGGGAVDLDVLTGRFVYVSDGVFEGIDTFGVVASDGALGSAPATVTVTVLPNRPPTASGPPVVTTDEDVTVSGQLYAVDFDGDPVTFGVHTPPAHGTLTLSSSTGHFVYQPDPDFSGDDGFVTVATDGLLTSSPVPTDVVVAPVNDPPTIQDASLTVDAADVGTVTLLTADPDGDPLTIEIVAEPAHGAATIEAGDVLRYAPDADFEGLDSVRVEASDGLATAEAVVTIDVI